LDIATSAHLDTGEWRRLVEQDEAATFFHTPAWSELLTSTLPGFRSSQITAREQTQVVGVMPVLERAHAGATTIESMAFGTFGGPIVATGSPAGTGAALLSGFSEVARSVRVGLAVVVDRSGRVTPEQLPGFVHERGTVQVVRLDADYDELQRRFRPSARNKIRKARKAGVRVRRAVGEADFLEYHRVLEICSRDWKIRPRPGMEFFVAMSALDPESVQMWLATDEAGDVIAGDLNFVSHGTIMNWGNVSTDAAKSLAPNNLLHAKAIEQGVADGHSVYDLGSSGGLEGVRKFKSSFGTEDVAITRFVREKGWYRAAKRVARR
jgi:CelD/BcsL family acetyltransferase involved in cellulose biosynthesis